MALALPNRKCGLPVPVQRHLHTRCIEEVRVLRERRGNRAGGVVDHGWNVGTAEGSTAHSPVAPPWTSARGPKSAGPGPKPCRRPHRACRATTPRDLCTLEFPLSLVSVQLAARVVWSQVRGGGQTPGGEGRLRYESGLTFVRVTGDQQAGLAHALEKINAAGAAKDRNATLAEDAERDGVLRGDA